MVKTRKPKKRTGKIDAATVLIVVLAAVLFFFIGWILRGRQLGSDVALMAQVHHYLLAEAHPQEPSSGRELSYAAARGMVDALDDPYSALIVPPMSYRYQDDFEGNVGVVGLHAEKHDSDMVVEIVFPGEPADQAGILPGDVILSVDGIALTEDINEVEASLLIRGPVGEPVKMVIERGADTLQLSPIREPRPKVSSQMMGDVGYIYQHTFTTDTDALFKEALEGLLAQNPQAIIWDLRSNGGGSTDTSQVILNYFIGDGILFTAEQSRGRVREFAADKTKVIDGNIPLVVLIGHRTYSAAEMAAATISDSGRGTTIGGTTYGKGTIYAAIPLANDAILQLTIARWLSPTGQSYNVQGVQPDIAIQDDPNTPEDEVLQYALDYILQGKVSGPGG